ncbi:MarR family transcriptional regulator [Roseibacterium sp. SDUM158016]|uniref:MarR family winged helix-turn-helix transcriptional regulator n=1 Tax=Roseicyclus sediminis TaxID=2980997 RepID=UPI0021D02846|nr:MarR family transcriptional regulator [Roseibacterium sp. SDUM158016]MCU4653057.1 MarR family transcriptional regulator [Roseibacterium sp. SDUM158016]
MAPDDDFELTDFTPYLLNAAAEAQSQEFSRVYRDRYGMLRTEWRVLFHLGRYGEMSAREISRRASIHKTKVSRAVSALEAKRFLQRRPSEEDRRVELLALRPPGRAAFDDLSRAAAAHEAELEARLGTQRLGELRLLLRELAM